MTLLLLNDIPLLPKRKWGKSEFPKTDDCRLAMTILQETLSLAGRHALSGEFLAPEELHLIPGQVASSPWASVSTTVKWESFPARLQGLDTTVMSGCLSFSMV